MLASFNAYVYYNKITISDVLYYIECPLRTTTN